MYPTLKKPTEELEQENLKKMIASGMVTTNAAGYITHYPIGCSLNSMVRRYNESLRILRGDPRETLNYNDEKSGPRVKTTEGRHTHDGPPNIQNIAERAAGFPPPADRPWDNSIQMDAPRSLNIADKFADSLRRKPRARGEKSRLFTTMPRGHVGETMLLEHGKVIEHSDMREDEVRKNRLTVYRIATPHNFRLAFEALFREVPIENFAAFMHVRRNVPVEVFMRMYRADDVELLTRAMLTAELGAFVGWDRLGAESVTLRIVELSERWK